MILLLSATFLFIGVANSLISNTKINDIDEAKYFSMILSGLGLQFLILVFNVVTSEDGGLGFDENDTALTIMALGVATIGMVSNPDQKNVKIGKAGRNRWRGKRPQTRGVAMNPVDHPHGGGEGKTSGGRSPVSPWGQSAKGLKTRRPQRSDKRIITRRKKRKK